MDMTTLCREETIEKEFICEKGKKRKVLDDDGCLAKKRNC